MNLILETREISTLLAYERNAKRHGAEDISAIAASIQRFGFNDPIGILPDGTIVEGHGRLAAAEQLGLTEVPVLVLHGMTPEQADLYRIAHNKITLSSTFDFRLLVDTLRELVDDGLSVTSMGFNEELYAGILRMFPTGTDADAAAQRPDFEQVYDYEVIWDDADQRKRWGEFVRGLQARYGEDVPLGTALTLFIQECGVLDAMQENEVVHHG